MKPVSRVLLLLLVFTVTTREGSAQTADGRLEFPPPPSAVERDAKAWRELSSPAGGFAVLMPGEPQEGSGSAETDIGVVKIHTFPLVTAAASYLVGYTEFPVAVTDPEGVRILLDAAVERAVGMDRNKLVRQTDISLGGKRGRRFEIEVPHLDCVMNGRAYFAHRRLYTLIVMTRRHKGAAPETVEFYESVIDKFLGSFRFVGGNPRPGVAKK